MCIYPRQNKYTKHFATIKVSYAYKIFVKIQHFKESNLKVNHLRNINGPYSTPFKTMIRPVIPSSSFLQLALCGLFDYREFDCFVFLVPIGNRKVAGVAFG